MQTRVAAAKQDFARLMLGFFASSTAAYPLTFEYVAQAEAPEGKADVLDVRGPAGFVARLFINSQSHLPIMVSWRMQPPPARGGPPPGRQGAPQGRAGTPPQGRGAEPPGSTPAAPVESRLYFAEYRDVDGLKLPFRIRRAVGSDTTEETTFDRFRINARTDARRFEVGN
jgi:hypothetical protein